MNRFKSYMQDFGIAAVCAVLLALVYVSDSHAAEVLVDWDWPATYCPKPGQTVGDPLPLADIQAAEIYISEATIPSSGQACSDPADVPPTGTILATASAPTSELAIDLPCGKQYFFRMRIQAANLWSNLSNEGLTFVSCGRPEVPVLIQLTT